MSKPASRRLMIFEPRLGGHHLTWLRYVTEDCLAGGFQLCLAVDLRPQQREMIFRHLDELQSQITMISVYDSGGAYRGGSKTRALTICFQESGAEQILMTNFDEVASLWLRKAAFGIEPPGELLGRLNCIYFRPRFLADLWSPGNIIKRVGFTRLCRKKWFINLYLLDEYLCKTVQTDYPGLGIYFLPDPWSGNFTKDKALAMEHLGVPKGSYVFLQYGLGTRRKGLDLVIDAFDQNRRSDWFLLCAGKIDNDRQLLKGLAGLERAGRALILNRYVTPKEEELCFAASDIVLLPYVGHFGSSAVLSRATAAGKTVIATNEGLLGRRVFDHGLGMLFESGQVTSLFSAMEMVSNKKSSIQNQQAAAFNYAASCTREAFRKVLLGSLGNS